jgi:hypothetical protein
MLLEVEAEEKEVDEKRKISFFRPRRVLQRESYRESFWFNFMQRDLTDLRSRDGKNFRLPFTVPYQVYTQLLAYAEALFPQKEYDICGRETSPVSSNC